MVLELSCQDTLGPTKLQGEEFGMLTTEIDRSFP